MVILKHYALPHLTRYATAQTLQETLVAAHLKYKASLSTPNPLAQPPPAIITAQFHPVYTTGRRDLHSLSLSQRAHLLRDGAELHEALRGGQTTFHGPGQLTAYVVADLRRHGLSARCHVDALEGAVISLLEKFGVRAGRTENPGVWSDDEHKICAVGVHLRRFVSAHGIGLNVTQEPLPWLHRITACGLEGKRASCIEGITGMEVPGGVERVADMFVEEMCGRLKGVEGVDKVLG